MRPSPLSLLARLALLAAFLVRAGPVQAGGLGGADVGRPAAATTGTALLEEAEPSDCGPPSEDIPGPPARLIRVGQPMPEPWLVCYIWRDLRGQDYFPERFGEVRGTLFSGYPVECWNDEATDPTDDRSTPGLVAVLYAHNRDGQQYVRFTYRIQLDGDYINNCTQDILPGAD